MRIRNFSAMSNEGLIIEQSGSWDTTSSKKIDHAFEA